MTVAYSYAINTVRVVTQGELVDVVKEIDVNVWGAEGDLTFHLPVTVPLPEADSGSFTPFASLTLEQATAWIDASSVVERSKKHIEAVIARRIEEAAMQTKPLPWAQ